MKFLENLEKQDAALAEYNRIHQKQDAAFPRQELERPTNPKAEMRIFATGATRESDKDKLDFEGFDSPLVTKRYAQYLHKHRKQADGTMRGSDNWQAGMEKEVYIKSLVRHMEDVKLHWDGYGEEAVVNDFEEALCAVLFNAKGMLYELLIAKKRST